MFNQISFIVSVTLLLWSAIFGLVLLFFIIFVVKPDKARSKDSVVIAPRESFIEKNSRLQEDPDTESLRIGSTVAVPSIQGTFSPIVGGYKLNQQISQSEFNKSNLVIRPYNKDNHKKG